MLDQVIWGNTIAEYLHSGALFLGICALLYAFRRGVLDRLRALAQDKASLLPEAAGNFLDKFRMFEGVLLALWIAIKQLHVEHEIMRDFYVIVLLILTYRVVRICQNIAALVVSRAIVGEGEAGPVQTDTARNVALLADILLWIAGLTFVLANLGVKITALLTGLGIGGVAVALAAQAILSDLFSAAVIFVDKPFVVGDDIALDSDWKGVVEHIGLKTTRVRAPTGEMQVVPNSVMTSSKLRNNSRRRERRVVFGWGLAQGTSAEKLRRAVALAKEIVSKTPQVRLERAHFKGIGSWGMDLEVCFTVHDSDYERYLDVNQEIQLALVEGLKTEGIELAPPKA
jgi:small-conductance mechanosensitive channel